MSNVKISQLPSATTPLGGTEVLPIVQGTTTKKVTVANLRGTVVTAVTGTAPVVSSGGTTPAISMPAATSSVNGYLTSTDWSTFNGKYSVGGALGTPSSGTATNLTGLPLTTGVTGILPVANGGNGTATPSLVAGANVTITGTWPNQTIASTGGSGGVTSFSAGTTGLTPATATTGAVTLAGTLAVANGGTGTTTPSLVAGTNVTITGTWPNQTINSSGGGGGMVYPGAGIPLSTGSAWGTSYSTTGTGDVVLSTSPTLVTPLLGTPTSGNFSTGTFTWPTFNQNTTGTAANITASSNSTLTTLSALSLPGSQVSGNISGNAANVTGIVAVANGGTGTATPSLVAGTNITISGSFPNQTINASGGGTPGGSNTQVQYNNAGAFAGSANLTFDGTTRTAAGLAGPLNGTVGATTANTGAFTTLSATGVTTVQAGSAAAPAITTTGDTNTGIFFPAADTIAFAEGGAEVARFSSAGNFGIGTNSPAQLIDGTAANPRMRLTATSTGYATSQFANTSGSSYFGRDDSTGGFFGIANGTVVYSSSSDPIGFFTSGSERARIDSSGNFLVGATSANAQGQVEVTFNGSTKQGINVIDSSAASTSTAMSFIKSAGTRGSITVTATGTLYNVTSDYRLKTVIGPVADAGQRIDALQPVEYTWNADGSRTRGFLAHQFQEVYPSSVTGSKDAVDAEGKPIYQQMQAGGSEVIADLVAEIKSLRQRLAAAGI